MLTYTCPTGNEEYKAEIIGSRVIYLAGNKRLELKSESDDCYMCEVELNKKLEQAKEKARAEIRETKKK